MEPDGRLQFGSRELAHLVEREGDVPCIRREVRRIHIGQQEQVERALFREAVEVEGKPWAEAAEIGQNQQDFSALA